MMKTISYALSVELVPSVAPISPELRAKAARIMSDAIERNFAALFVVPAAPQADPSPRGAVGGIFNFDVGA